jgi:hypothetical protein
MATTTWVARWPRAITRRKRGHRRPGACQLMAWRGCGRFSSRRGRGRLTWAGERSAQAPSTRARRAWVGPAGVLAPWRRRSPLEYAAGITPRDGMRCLGDSPRGTSPRSTPVVTATGNGTPRQAGSAATTGGQRHDWTCAWRAGSRRGRRSVCAVIARTSSWQTMCGAEGDRRLRRATGGGPGARGPGPYRGSHAGATRRAAPPRPS